MPRVGNPENRRPTFIKEWRIYRGLTQEQLAERLETSKTTISELESGNRGYTQDGLEAIAEALGTDPASLLMRRPGQDEIWSVWEQAKPGQKTQIIEVVKTIIKTG